MTIPVPEVLHQPVQPGVACHFCGEVFATQNEKKMHACEIRKQVFSERAKTAKVYRQLVINHLREHAIRKDGIWYWLVLPVLTAAYWILLLVYV